jgi:hypothetical protein
MTVCLPPTGNPFGSADYTFNYFDFCEIALVTRYMAASEANLLSIAKVMSPLGKIMQRSILHGWRIWSARQRS